MRATVEVVALPTDAGRQERRDLAESLVARTHGPVTRLCPNCASTDHGRPRARGVHLSLSYAPGVVVVALADVPVGVDVERADGPVPDGVADRQAWTRLEAVLKATGEGLRRDPATVREDEAWTATLPALAGYVASVAVLADAADLSWRIEPAGPGAVRSRPTG